MIGRLSLLLVAASGSAQVAEPQALNVKAAQEQVCASERQPFYLNTDFVVHNPTNKEVALKEIRATVRTGSETVIEKRVIWQGALDMLG